MIPRRAFYILIASILVWGSLQFYSAERSRCTGATTYQFFAHTARGLSTAISPQAADPPLTPRQRGQLAERLLEDANELDGIGDDCSWPWEGLRFWETKD